MKWYNLFTLFLLLAVFLVSGCTQQTSKHSFQNNVSEPTHMQNSEINTATANEKNLTEDKNTSNKTASKTIDVPPTNIQTPTIPEPKVEEFVIEGDDKGLYPNKITVHKGDTIILTLKAREKGTYFGGLDFRSDVWGNTGKIKSGENTTVQFTAEESFQFKSYWPATNKLKSTGQVEVE